MNELERAVVLLIDAVNGNLPQNDQELLHLGKIIARRNRAGAARHPKELEATANQTPQPDPRSL